MESTRSAFSRAKHHKTKKGYDNLTDRHQYILMHMSFLYSFVHLRNVGDKKISSAKKKSLRSHQTDGDADNDDNENDDDDEKEDDPWVGNAANADEAEHSDDDEEDEEDEDEQDNDSIDSEQQEDAIPAVDETIGNEGGQSTTSDLKPTKGGTVVIGNDNETLQGDIIPEDKEANHNDSRDNIIVNENVDNVITGETYTYTAEPEHSQVIGQNVTVNVSNPQRS